jgi:hypothetical protein
MSSIGTNKGRKAAGSQAVGSQSAGTLKSNSSLISPNRSSPSRNSPSRNSPGRKDNQNHHQNHNQNHKQNTNRNSNSHSASNHNVTTSGASLSSNKSPASNKSSHGMRKQASVNHLQKIKEETRLERKELLKLTGSKQERSLDMISPIHVRGNLMFSPRWKNHEYQTDESELNFFSPRWKNHEYQTDESKLNWD